MRKYLLLIVIVSLVSITISQTGLSSNSSTGTTSAAFLKSQCGVRANAMGNAYIAVAQDNDAIYFNPAGLAFSNAFEVSSMYSSQLLGISDTNASIILPYSGSALAFALDYQNTGGIEETTVAQPSGTGQTLNFMNYTLISSYAKQLTPGISFGLNGKLLNESICGSDLQGYAADFGILWRLSDTYTCGAVLKNIAGSFGKSPLPANYGLGLACNYKPVLLAIDVNMPNDNNTQINIGAEYNFNDTLFGRVGINTGSEENSIGNISAGIGIKKEDFDFNYAYVPYGDLGATHRFSINLMPFGELTTKLE
ncbi:MAG: PorV/PorQ family protein [Candidatus Margulisiibacteriota bacterium]